MSCPGSTGPQATKCYNQNVAHILAIGSSKASLQTEVLAIFATAMSNQIRIEAG